MVSTSAPPIPRRLLLLQSSGYHSNIARGGGLVAKSTRSFTRGPTSHSWSDWTLGRATVLCICSFFAYVNDVADENFASVIMVPKRVAFNFAFFSRSLGCMIWKCLFDFSAHEDNGEILFARYLTWLRRVLFEYHGSVTGCRLLFWCCKRTQHHLPHNCIFRNLSDEYLMPCQAQSSPTFTTANTTVTLPTISSLARGANHLHDTWECANSPVICACDPDWVMSHVGSVYR